MTYQEYVKDVFTEHHSAMGMDEEEIKDLLGENNFSQIERWLQKVGYDLNEYKL